MLEQSMDELRKTKMDLPSPAQANEFPKKPFGVFIEPNFEAKVSVRLKGFFFICATDIIHFAFSYTGGFSQIHIYGNRKRSNR